ncbi:MAG: ACP S-malonyltransferase [Thiomonas sp.]|uniref:ACP S-malonyltransferase n=1 Tax=Thiomonas sp. TaxID=2047785 RepID=UPI002A3602B8|nr:ACP S-malonyltransferase [Thiomonas sp.]MDY0329635.1 ACP S-malonyltransferase [Thiomonas sp.]
MTFAFVFPGQGSQSVGMLDKVAAHPAVRATLEEAGAALGQDVGALIAQGPAEQLNLTTNTQPVMLTAGVALYRLWLAEGGRKPDCVAGHSLGEYTALVAAESLTLGDALPLVRFRAQAMQEAVPVGAGGMAAVLGLDDAAVRAGCAQAARETGEVVEAVNFNAPGQVVIAGTQAAIARACEVLKAAGAKRALPLAVSAPFHSSLLQGAADRLRAYLQGVAIKAPQITLINNVDVAHPTDPESIRDALARQACHAVRWVECVQAIARAGCSTLVECGPGKVLHGLTRRIDPALQSFALDDLSAIPSLQTALA